MAGVNVAVDDLLELVGVELFFLNKQVEGGDAFFFPEILETVGNLGGGVQFRQVAVDELLDQLAFAAEFDVAGYAIKDELADAGPLRLVRVVETGEQGGREMTRRCGAVCSRGRSGEGSALLRGALW